MTGPHLTSSSRPSLNVAALYQLLPMVASAGMFASRQGLRYVEREDVLTVYAPDGAPLSQVTTAVQGKACLCVTTYRINDWQYYLVDPLHASLEAHEWWEQFYFKDHIRIHPLGVVRCQLEAFILEDQVLRHRYGAQSVIATLSAAEEEVARHLGFHNWKRTIN